MDALPEPKTKRKGQVRPRVRDALRLIVTEGRSITEAAQTVGMTREALSRALKRPAVLEAKASLASAWRESRTEAALVSIATLSTGASSEDVRLKASRTWLEIEGLLGPGRRDERSPGPGVAVQILIGEGAGRREVRLNGSGVVEAPAFRPCLSGQIEAHEDDDEREEQ